MHRYLLFLFFFAGLCGSSFALDKPNPALLAYAKACPQAARGTMTSLVNYLKKGASTEAETVELLSYWIADNIAYDTRVLQAGGTVATGNNPLVSKKGVCQDYAKLMQQLCKAMNIECHVVTGYSKGFGYRKGQQFTEIDHAWNVIRVNGDYVFVDVTWASGGVKMVNGVPTFKKELDVAEIMADPAYFALKHLPGDPRWQLRSQPITVKSFGKNDSLAGMLQELHPHYQYLDSIKAFALADSTEQRLISATGTYRFNPNEGTLKGLANATYNKAWVYGNRFKDREHIEQSLVWYDRAIRQFEQLDSNYGRTWVVHCQKGITYSNYLLQQLGSKGG